MSRELHPLVSVIVPTFNHSMLLERSLESILSQDYKNIEVIISDDASTDGTQHVVAEYAGDSRVRVFLNKENIGITKNARQALLACKGKYVSLMAGDDLMYEGKIREQVEHMESNPGCDICYHDLDVLELSSGKVTARFSDTNLVKKKSTIKECIKHGPFNGGCSNMVRRSKIPEYGYDTRVSMASDWLLWVDILAQGGTMDYLDEVLGAYGRHEGNATSKPNALLLVQDHLFNVSIIMTKYPEHYKEALYRASVLFIRLRHIASENRLDYLKISWRLRKSIRALGGIIMSKMRLMDIVDKRLRSSR